MMYEEEARHLSTSTTYEKIQLAQEMLMANQQVIINEVACSLLFNPS